MKRSWGVEREEGLSISPRVGRDSRVLLRAVAGEFDVRCLSSSNLADGRVRARRRMGMDITWVTDRIAVGGGIWTAENMAAVSRTGITHIINMQIEFDDTALAEAHGIEVCWNPIDDDFEAKPADVFRRGVDFALAALEVDGSKVYVHCAAGVHRAPMMTLALLCVMGWTLEDGMELIEKRRPVADFADVYVRSVENFLLGRN
jgi:protein-tyrosine phosphatase